MASATLGQKRTYSWLIAFPRNRRVSVMVYALGLFRVQGVAPPTAPWTAFFCRGILRCTPKNNEELHFLGQVSSPMLSTVLPPFGVDIGSVGCNVACFFQQTRSQQIPIILRHTSPSNVHLQPHLSPAPSCVLIHSLYTQGCS